MHLPLLVLLAAASSAFAQTDQSYFPGLIQVLSGAGLNNLANVTQNISNTTTGRVLFETLPNGNKTLFAPTDRAFSATPPSNITDPNELADILSYHVVIGSFSNASSPPNDTIVRTELNATQLVSLEGNKSQVMVLNSINGTLTVVQPPTSIPVISMTTYRNLIINVVDTVIAIPPNLTSALVSQNLSALAAISEQTGLSQTLESAHGITLFAPNDTAVSLVNPNIGNNRTLLKTVLGNHVINGTSVYSTEFNANNWVSASGEPFIFRTSGNGTFVSSGSSTARIIEKDVLMSNGVMHIIDNVLLNTQNNTQAANSAFASATSAAAHSTTETAGVGATATSTSQSASTTGSSSGAVTVDIPLLQWGVGILMASAGGALIL